MKKLLPCPFCGGEAGIERTGTPRQSCIVACVNCGARHESGDEAQFSGASWNRRTQPAPAITSESGKHASQGASAITSVPVLTDEEIVYLTDEIPLREGHFIKVARAIEQAVRSKLGAGVGWQPIETAPKDGTEILLSNGEVVAQGNWLHAEPYIREKRDLDGRYVDQEEFEGYDGWIDQSGGMQPDPTHWQPLPPPPGIVGKEGGNV